MAIDGNLFSHQNKNTEEIEMIKVNMTPTIQ
jgi:hypothetical protein